jgi:hypothetical protein
MFVETLLNVHYQNFRATCVFKNRPDPSSGLPCELSVGFRVLTEACSIGQNNFGHKTAKHPATIAKIHIVFPVPNSTAIFV